MSRVTSFHQTLADYMVESTCLSFKEFFTYLGGASALNVTEVYFIKWLRGKALPKVEKLEFLLRSIPEKKWKTELTAAYFKSLCENYPIVKNLMEKTEEKQDSGIDASNLPTALHHNKAKKLKLSIRDTMYFAQTSDRYLVFSILLTRSLIRLDTTMETLASLSEIDSISLKKIVADLMNFEIICEHPNKGLELVGTEIEWPNAPEAQIAFEILKKYDDDIHSRLRLRRRARCKSDLFVLAKNDLENYTKELQALEEKYYNKQLFRPRSNAKLVYYQSNIHVSDNWLKDDAKPLCKKELQTYYSRLEPQNQSSATV